MTASKACWTDYYTFVSYVQVFQMSANPHPVSFWSRALSLGWVANL